MTKRWPLRTGEGQAKEPSAAPPASARRLLPLAAVLALSLLSAWPLLSERAIAGHDTVNYLPRLVEFHENIRHGIFPPRWAPDLNSGWGEPTWVFVPPLPQAVAEPFFVLGASVVRAHNLGLLGLVLLAAFSCHALGRRWGGEPCGFVCAAAFLFAPYFHVDLIVRHAAAELAGLCFLPLVLLGCDALAGGRRRAGVLQLAAGVAGATLCHQVVGLLATLLALTMAVGFALFRRERSLLVGAGAGLALGLALSCTSWLPALAEKQHGRLGELQQGALQYEQHFVEPLRLVHSPWRHGLSTAGSDDGMSLSLGLAQLLLAAGAAHGLRRASGLDRARVSLLGLVLLGSAFMSTAFSAPLWEQLPLLSYFAFPWRWHLLSTVALAGLAAMAVRAKPRLAMLAVLVLVAFGLPRAFSARLADWDRDGYAPGEIARRAYIHTMRDEYRPRWAEIKSSHVEQETAPLLPAELTSSRPDLRRWTITSPTDQALRLRLYWFPGWSLTVDGEPVAAGPSSPQGAIELQFPAGTHEVEARFTRTPVRWVGDLVSLGALLATLGCALPWLRRAKDPQGLSGARGHSR